jgi:diguanylate cyclase (GGDEF)-like protein
VADCADDGIGCIRGNSFALPVPTTNSRRITDVLRALALGREQISALLLASAIAAATSLVVVAALLGGAPATPLLPLVVLLQIGTIGCILGARRAISRRLTVLERLAESDPATGCLNRRGFERALDAALAAAVLMQHDVALLAVDLDHFKRINDQFGHNVGDAVLSEVAATLADTVGTDGVVARIGGEEFSVLLPRADAEVAGAMAERMHARLRTHQLAAVTRSAMVTMSVGIAVERVSSIRDSAALRARADEALYMAKRGGRDRVLLWAPGVRSLATPAAVAATLTQPPRRSVQHR